MGTRLFGWWSFCSRLAATSQKNQAQSQASAAKVAPSALAPQPIAEPAPEGCKAKGDKPLQIGTVLGDSYGFAGDSTHLYCATWQVYGGRGDLTKIRKDGQGSEPLAGLKLEPRGLALDRDTVYFTSGIRLIACPRRVDRQVRWTLSSLRRASQSMKLLSMEFPAITAPMIDWPRSERRAENQPSLLLQSDLSWQLVPTDITPWHSTRQAYTWLIQVMEGY